MQPWRSRPRPDDLHLLFIHRAEHEEGSLVGHRFSRRAQGSRRSDLLNTVRRSSREIAVDLRNQARPDRPVDRLQVARGRHLPLVIAVRVRLGAAGDPRPNHEVQSILWVR